MNNPTGARNPASTDTSDGFISAPAGARAVDVYLIGNERSVSVFMSKSGDFSHYPSYQRLGQRSGVVRVNGYTTGTYFIAYKNPGSVQGLSVSFEVVAITEGIESEKNSMLDIINQTMESSRQKQAKQKTSDASLEKAITYGNIGWKAYTESDDVDNAILYSKKALSFVYQMSWVKANLGLFYLLKGEEFTSTDYYLEALADLKMSGNSDTRKAHLKEYIADIDRAVRARGSLKGAATARSLLVTELTRL